VVASQCTALIASRQRPLSATRLPDRPFPSDQGRGVAISVPARARIPARLSPGNSAGMPIEVAPPPVGAEVSGQRNVLNEIDPWSDRVRPADQPTGRRDPPEVPAVAGPARLVSLAALANGQLSARALRTAAGRGRLRAQRDDRGQWRSAESLAVKTVWGPASVWIAPRRSAVRIVTDWLHGARWALNEPARLPPPPHHLSV
jgi:hypothetical protein